MGPALEGQDRGVVMAGTELPATVMVCCPLPATLPVADAEACLAAGGRTTVPVTWIAPLERLSLVADSLRAAGSRSALAVEIPAAATGSRQSLRHLLRQAHSEADDLDAAVLHGPLSAEARRELVDGGIRIVCRDRFDAAQRGTRRPAPPGWPCRSTLWGLWEVTRTVAVPPSGLRRFLPWTTVSRARRGSLAVVDAGGGDSSAVVTGSTLRRGLERWEDWARRQATSGAVVATLSDLPELIAGSARVPEGGSVLRAA